MCYNGHTKLFCYFEGKTLGHGEVQDHMKCVDGQIMCFIEGKAYAHREKDIGRKCDSMVKINKVILFC